MKKNIKKISAFTLIEIMLVVAIISFLTVSWISYFNNFVDEKKIETNNLIIESKINELNQKVKNKEILDYKALFIDTKDYLLYRYNQTIKAVSSTISIDKTTRSFTLSLNLTDTWSWEVKLYKDNKFLNSKLIDQRDAYTGFLNQYQNYYFDSNFTLWQDNIWIMYFSEDNLTNSWIETSFTQANTKQDKSWLKTTDFILENINWNLKFYSWSLQWDTKEVYLFFEKWWFEKSIKISKK